MGMQPNFFIHAVGAKRSSQQNSDGRAILSGFMRIQEALGARPSVAGELFTMKKTFKRIWKMDIIPRNKGWYSNVPYAKKTLHDSYKLKLHMQNAHEEEKNPGHECGICGQLYANPHVLRRHIQSIHLERGDANNVETKNAIVVTVSDNKGPDEVPAFAASSPTENQPGDAPCVKEDKVDTILGF